MGLYFTPSNFTIQAIPARDLTDEEVEQWGEDYLIATGLYKREQQAPAAPIEKPKRKTRKANRELAKDE
jgi:hypothetical protein